MKPSLAPAPRTEVINGYKVCVTFNLTDEEQVAAKRELIGRIIARALLRKKMEDLLARSAPAEATVATAAAGTAQARRRRTREGWAKSRRAAEGGTITIAVRREVSMAFVDTWTALQTSLQAGATIQNWTAHSGTVGEPFEIEAVSRNVIVINAPGATTPQSVRRADFEAIYELWVDYLSGTIPRSAFTPLTWYSKYVISILHWLQRRSGGRLP